MNEMVLDTTILPEPIIRLIHTSKFKVREISGELLITPVREESVDCPFAGMFADGRVSATKFMAQKRWEKELDILGGFHCAGTGDCFGWIAVNF